MRAENDTPGRDALLFDDNGEVRVLNVRPELVNVSASKRVAKKIADLLIERKLVPTKVKIFADHPIVKDALTDRTLQITASINNSLATILVPFSHKGNRVIAKSISAGRESYVLYALPDDSSVDLDSCLKH